MFFNKSEITPQQLIKEAETLRTAIQPLQETKNIEPIKQFAQKLKQFLENTTTCINSEPNYAPLQAHKITIDHFLSRLNSAIWSYQQSKTPQEKIIDLREIRDILSRVSANLFLFTMSTNTLIRITPIPQ